MRSLYKQAVAVLIFTALSGCAAQPGYHYVDYVQVPDDLCELSFVNEPGTLSWLNASIGKPNGVSEKVVSIRNSSSTNIENPWKSPVICHPEGASCMCDCLGYSLFGPRSPAICHGTLVFANGNTASGFFALTYPGYPVTVTWTSDAELAKKKEEHEQQQKLASEPLKFTEENMLALKSVKATEKATAQEWAERARWFSSLTAAKAKKENKEEFKTGLFLANSLGEEIFDLSLIEGCGLRSEQWENELANSYVKGTLTILTKFNLTHKQFESLEVRMDKAMEKKDKELNGKSNTKICERAINELPLQRFDQYYDQIIADRVLPAVPRSEEFGLALENAKETGNMLAEIGFVTNPVCCAAVTGKTPLTCT